MNMGRDEFDEEIDGEPHFMQIPSDWVGDYGRIVVLGGRIEFAAYALAGTLDAGRSPNGRTSPFGSTCKALIRALNEPSISGKFDERWAGRVREWATTAPTVMDEHRNYHLHALTMMRSDGKKWHPARVERHDDFGTVRVLERDELRASIKALLVIDKEGSALWTTYPPFFLTAHMESGG